MGSIQNAFYGVPIPNTGFIDMMKNPLYGKEILDIRDNIIKKNKDIQNMVDTINNPQAKIMMDFKNNEYKLYKK